MLIFSVSGECSGARSQNKQNCNQNYPALDPHRGADTFFCHNFDFSREPLIDDWTWTAPESEPHREGS